MTVTESHQYHLLQLAYRESLKSTDPSTQLGAVCAGWDQRPETIWPGHNRPAILGDENGWHTWSREVRLQNVIHAEVDAVLSFLERSRDSPQTLVCPWAACAECAKFLVRCRIRRLVRHRPRMALTSTWGNSIELGDSILHRAGVEIVNLEGPVDAGPIRHGGRLWCPKELRFVGETP